MENIVEEIQEFYKKNKNQQLGIYKKQVEKYAQTSASDWKEEVRIAFLKHSEVASTGQSRFTNETIDKLSKGKDWDILVDYINKIIDSKKKESIIKACEEFDKLFDDVKNGEKNKLSISLKVIPRLAIRAMICSLKPDRLCRIVKEKCLDYLYNYIDKKVFSEESTLLESDKNKWKEEVQEKWNDFSWYKKSYAIADFFNTILLNGTKEDDLLNFAAVPWDFYEEKVFLEQMIVNLELQKNIIFTGAPGTGKTYLAKEIAKCMTKGKDENIGKVQFHPSYDYTDFVEGLRPNETGNSFHRTDGTFKDFCKKALKNPTESFVFIIDEINRGEISKIFGELFFSIDPGYRGIEGKVKTQYQNLVEDGDVFKDGFYVPENVYIIGTMNDIDRSVESMDFAFRRRFAFHEVTAEDSENIINSLYKDIEQNSKVNCDEIREKMCNLNETLVSDKCGLTTAYQIGGAYFLKLKDVNFKYDRLWNEYLYGVLYEYFRGEPDAEEKLAVLKEAFDKKDE